MTAAIDVIPMDVHRDTSSPAMSDTGRSDMVQSDVTQPSTVEECDLPNWHVTKGRTRVSPFAKCLEQEPNGVFQLQEAVASTLFKASPDILVYFVDPMVGAFKAVFKGEKQLVIWRKGNAGFIGIFEHHTSLKAFGFDHLVGFSIGYDGTWRIIIGAGNAFCAPKWPEVWTGKFECFGGVKKMVIDRESMEQAKVERAARLATKMLEGKFWEATADVKAT